MTGVEFAKLAEKHGGVIGKEKVDPFVLDPSLPEEAAKFKPKVPNPVKKERYVFADGSSVEAITEDDGSFNVTKTEFKAQPTPAATDKRYSPERIAEARARRAQPDAPSGTPGESQALDKRGNAKAFLQDIEDKLALGEITDADAARQWAAWQEENWVKPRQEAELARQGLAQAQARHTAAANATAVRQRTSEQDRYTRSRDRQQDARQAAQDARLAANDARSASIQAAGIGESAAQRAINDAQQQRPQQEMAAYQAARQQGKDPVAALGAAAALPPLDLDAIAEEATRRVLARYGLSPTPTPAPTATPAGPGTTSAAPASATRPTAPGATPAMAGVGAPPYVDPLDAQLGRYQ